MTYSREQLAQTDEALWFCLRAQTKREHVGAAGLRKQMELDCFAPRLRFRKMTRRGAVWFVEAMFPGYLFAKFVYRDLHRRVEHASGIYGLVQFGDHVATLGADVISRMQEKAGNEELVTIEPGVELGQSVRITEGPLQGMEALVTQLMPAKERVRVLLAFLGRSIETEVPAPKVLPLKPAMPDTGYR
jgi:transcriptional antiterminator RfaH